MSWTLLDQACGQTRVVQIPGLDRVNIWTGSELQIFPSEHEVLHQFSSDILNQDTQRCKPRTDQRAANVKRNRKLL